ncbi:2-hydroxyacid dehydrogenase [Salinimicrobium tongyeongense]|uniref:2-hydroxyacid dehydrogenase n=1 Tax=Salinimicrobium tongyeongense TaxID=2809707 RepID=A0ABY6NU92_9FLAO|nr:2-hydroxyacid dehydrogenase [Salinimicrobium tongyeongense]UZH56489.1 2-hydroxyacid dehydrogenase [Salinimicrobium tongyeongense]
MTILHADSNHPVLLQQLEAAGHQNIEAYTQSEQEILENQHLYDGIVIRSRFHIGREFLDAAPNLRFIARVGAGLESIDVDYAEQKGVKLFSAPEGNRNAVGEHALGMLLSLFNKLNQADRQVREGLWYREANRGLELEGKTVGIIGYGNMGKSFAKKFQGFDVKVLCYDILEGVGDEFAEQVSLEKFQKECDVVSLHTPWTPQTNKMLNKDFITAFEKPFWLLNTARGKSVVTEDLVAALHSKKILGAGLDVLEYEKSSFESLFSEGAEMPEALQQLLVMPNVLLSPHVAGWTVESHKKLADTIAQKIIDHFKDL